jgi:hypothetical protein
VYEGIEQLVHALPVQAHAGIPHHHAHANSPFPVPFRSAIASGDRAHRASRPMALQEQVDDDLMELDAIAGDWQGRSSASSD